MSTEQSSQAPLNGTIATMWRKDKDVDAMQAAVAIYFQHFKQSKDASKSKKLDSAGYTALRPYIGNTNLKPDDFIAMGKWERHTYQKCIDTLNLFKQDMKGNFKIETLVSFKVDTATPVVKLNLIRMMLNQGAPNTLVSYDTSLDFSNYKITVIKMGLVKALTFALDQKENNTAIIASISKLATIRVGYLKDDPDEFYNLLIAVRDKSFALAPALQNILGRVKASAPLKAEKRKEVVREVILAFNSDLDNKLLGSKVAICLASLAKDKNESVKGRAKMNSDNRLFLMDGFVKRADEHFQLVAVKGLTHQGVLVGFNVETADLQDDPRDKELPEKERRQVPVMKVIRTSAAFDYILKNSISFKMGLTKVRGPVRLLETDKDLTVVADSLLTAGDKGAIKINMHVLDYKYEELAYATKVEKGEFIGEKPKPVELGYSTTEMSKLDKAFEAYRIAQLEIANAKEAGPKGPTPPANPTADAATQPPPPDKA